MDACPQCHRPIKSPNARLVQDSCGHKKCRLCLMKDEDGCCLCAAKDKTVANIRRHSQRRLLTSESEICESVVAVPGTESDIVDVTTNQHKKKQFKDFESHNSHKSVSVQHKNESDPEKSPDTEILTDDDNHNRQSDDSLICCEDVIKDRCSLQEVANLPDSRVECEEAETTDVKLEKKRKPMIIASHITIAQGNPTMYTCTVCVKTFKRREHVRYHNFCATGDKPFKCDLCGQSFASKSHFECHHLNHTGARPYVCETCNRGFRQKDKLTRHIRIHTGERPFVCQDCGKGFIASHSLKTHQRTHTGEKPYLCPYCGRGFTETVNLRKHIIVHTGEKNFMCEGCGKSFGHKWALIHHQRTHSRERPHNCHICSRAFTNNKDLRRHFSVHSDTRPYNCSVCDTRFRRKDNLERHMKNTHPETRINSLNLLGKTYSEHLTNASNPQQQQMTTINDMSNPHHSTDALEKISNNIYKQISQQEVQTPAGGMAAVPYSRTDTQNTTNTQSPQFQASCIKSLGRPVSSMTVEADVKSTGSSETSYFPMTTDMTVAREVTQKPQSETTGTKCLKKVMDPDCTINVTSFKEMLDPVHDANFTNFKETLDPIQDTSATKLLEPIHAINIGKSQNVNSFKDTLDPAYDMSIANFKEISSQVCDTAITSFKEMLDPVRVTNIFPSGSLFQHIPEVKQKSQAVPVINRPITPSQQIISYGRTVKINLGHEKITMEGTNCVPTITKTSNVLQSNVLSATNSENQNVLMSAIGSRNLVCKKSGKVLEDYDKDTYISNRTSQSDLHWRKRTVELLQHQQEMAEDSGFI